MISLQGMADKSFQVIVNISFFSQILHDYPFLLRLQVQNDGHFVEGFYTLGINSKFLTKTLQTHIANMTTLFCLRNPVIIAVKDFTSPDKLYYTSTTNYKCYTHIIISKENCDRRAW